MICGMCKLAGRNSQRLPIVARYGHQKCLYPGTCTCQHQAGDGHLNTLAITRENAEAINEDLL